MARLQIRKALGRKPHDVGNLYITLPFLGRVIQVRNMIWVCNSTFDSIYVSLADMANLFYCMVLLCVSFEELADYVL